MRGLVQPDTATLDRLARAARRFIAPPAAELQHFLGLWRAATLRKGEAFVAAGTRVEHFGFVVKGIFRCHYLTLGGDDFIRNFVAEDEFLAEISAIVNGSESVVQVQAMEPASILVIPVGDVELL